MTIVAAVALALTTWLCEHDATSTATVQHGTFHFQLGSGVPRAQFAALVAPIERGLTAFSHVTFTARATRPMRINVDVRPVGTDNPPRWRRSVYIDDTLRTITVTFDDMHPIGGGAGPAPLATIGALMFVVDTNNTRPGTSADVMLSAVTLE